MAFDFSVDSIDETCFFNVFERDTNSIFKRIKDALDFDYSAFTYDNLQMQGKRLLN
jgi:hypothetical protein